MFSRNILPNDSNLATVKPFSTVKRQIDKTQKLPAFLKDCSLRYKVFKLTLRNRSQILLIQLFIPSLYDLLV